MVICSICRQRPARPKIGRGPTPSRCAECYHAKEHSRKAAKLIVASSRIAARMEQDAETIRARPRLWCRCEVSIGKAEGPLLICMLCSREIRLA